MSGFRRWLYAICIASLAAILHFASAAAQSLEAVSIIDLVEQGKLTFEIAGTHRDFISDLPTALMTLHNQSNEHVTISLPQGLTLSSESPSAPDLILHREYVVTLEAGKENIQLIWAYSLDHTKHFPTPEHHYQLGSLRSDDSELMAVLARIAEDYPSSRHPEAQLAVWKVELRLTDDEVRGMYQPNRAQWEEIYFYAEGKWLRENAARVWEAGLIIVLVLFVLVLAYRHGPQEDFRDSQLIGGSSGHLFKTMREQDKPVVVKFPAPGYRNAARLRRETRTLRRLSRGKVNRIAKYQQHGRAFVPLSAVANTPEASTPQLNGPRDIKPYVITDYIDGCSLGQLLRGDPDSEEAGRIGPVLYLGVQLASALTGLHRKQYVHLDLKPENVMVDVKGEVWLIDFGEAKNTKIPVFVWRSNKNRQWNAPEQNSLWPRLVRRETDQYCLALLLHQCFYWDKGDPPGRPDKQALDNYLEKHGVDRDARNAIVQCLNTSPKKRFRYPSLLGRLRNGHSKPVGTGELLHILDNLSRRGSCLAAEEQQVKQWWAERVRAICRRSDVPTD